MLCESTSFICLTQSDSGWQETSQRMDAVQIYDPIFILRFSIHTLLMSYIEPAEFARLGLLAITLVSIASPDQELRMLGYECLGAFKKSLEVCYFMNI
jgi:nucleolar pre-ribosomal-associated protein 1